MTGWLTAEASRYEVPAQKASTDEPPSERAISFPQVSCDQEDAVCWG
jgi:hypothetical protein